MAHQEITAPAPWKLEYTLRSDTLDAPAVTYTIHPFAAMWPRPSEEEFEQLKASIAAFGLTDPVLCFVGDDVADGWSRVRAVAELGLSADVFQRLNLEPDDAPGLIFAKNLARRHLSPEDRLRLATQHLELLGKRRATKDEVQQINKQSDKAPDPATVYTGEDVRKLAKVGKRRVPKLTKDQRSLVKKAKPTSTEGQQSSVKKTKTALRAQIAGQRARMKVLDSVLSPDSLVDLAERPVAPAEFWRLLSTTEPVRGVWTPQYVLETLEKIHDYLGKLIKACAGQAKDSSNAPQARTKTRADA